jgi:hypothetical protein
MEYSFDENHVRSLERAIQRNPQVVIVEVGKYLVRGIAVLNRGILRNPWRTGMAGGGAPVRTGNLRDTHSREVSQFSARVFPIADYAEKVHTGRPWLDYVFDTSQEELQQLEGVLLDNVTKDLAS